MYNFKISTKAACNFILLILLSFTASGASDDAAKAAGNFSVSLAACPDGSAVEGKAKVNLNLDMQTAVKLAEIVLVHIYGEDVLKERPWVVTETESYFRIMGIFHRPMIKGVVSVGGVAEIVIQKSDAKILKCIHGK